MSLTIPQKIWLNGATVNDIINQIDLGRVSMNDLAAFASENSAFAAKYSTVQAAIATRPDPAEDKEYNSAKAAYGADPYSDKTTTELKDYLRRWESNVCAAEHVADIRNMFNRTVEWRDFSALEAAYKDIADSIANGTPITSGNTFKTDIQQYLSKWSQADFAEIHRQYCVQWNTEYEQFERNLLKAEWQSLFDENGRLTSFDQMAQFLSRHPGIPTFSIDGDDKMWEWALAQDDIEAAIKKYDDYTRGLGRHSSDKNAVLGAMGEWQNVKNTGNIGAVKRFIEQNPAHSFISQAEDFYEELKQRELDVLGDSRNIQNYNIKRFNDLIDLGIFSERELQNVIGVDDEMFYNIRNYEYLRQTLPKEPDNNTPYKNGLAPGRTDVVFFGIPGTGKTCVLMGLLNNDNLSFDGVSGSGEYGQLLKSYTKAGIALNRTPTDFVATIVASTTSQSPTKAGEVRNHYFNLVDMAGEAFANKIARGKNKNGEIVTSFADMGKGAPEILNSDNDKVFFIIINPSSDNATVTDPTTGESVYVAQSMAINNMISLMFGNGTDANPNEDIMQRVKGLHFIVTKADTLTPGCEVDEAREIAHRLINSATFDNIVRGCKKYGINYSSDEKLNGRPRVFCYSLGNFTVGNMFDYVPKYSSQLLEILCDYSVPVKQTGFWHKLRKSFVG